VEGDPIIAPSARKHGVDDSDVMHAYWHPMRVFDLEEGLSMVRGPNRTAMLFEVGVVQGAEAPVIVHAMRARDKFLR
jgi:hypothetical protein